MKIRTSIAAAGTAVVLAGTGALLLPAVASAHSTTHTLKFTAVSLGQANFSSATGGQAEKDVNSANQTIGFDVIYVKVSSTTHQPTAGNVALSTNGGLLYGALKFSKGSVTGTVTGGTGTFKGATGTITAKSLTQTRTAVTVNYTTP